jgi:hypothetical protein
MLQSRGQRAKLIPTRINGLAYVAALQLCTPVYILRRGCSDVDASPPPCGCTRQAYNGWAVILQQVLASSVSLT